MIDLNVLCDPARTIDAGNIKGIIHIATIVKDHFRTACGSEIEQGDLLIFRQLPEDITCPKCKKLLTTQNDMV